MHALNVRFLRAGTSLHHHADEVHPTERAAPDRASRPEQPEKDGDNEWRSDVTNATRTFPTFGFRVRFGWPSRKNREYPQTAGMG